MIDLALDLGSSVGRAPHYMYMYIIVLTVDDRPDYYQNTDLVRDTLNLVNSN